MRACLDPGKGTRRPPNRTPALLVLLIMLPTLLLVAGCARKIPPPPFRGPDAAPGATVPTARPYTVLGQTYHPLTSADGFVEEGVASWYGPGFHAKRTASGEIYNMYALTAAHRILPMQTKIRVTSLKNGKSVVLRVNDRGPFVKDRIVDLSYAAAQKLDMIRPGTARVRVEALGRWPGGMPGRFFVQVGAFSFRENADKMLRALQNAGYKSTRIVLADVDGRNFWRVQVGEFPSLDQAEKVLESLASRNPSAFVIAD
jgi:rare lipoprotein A